MCLFRMNSKFTNQSTLTLLWEPAPAPWGSGSLDDQLTPGTAILCEAIVLGLTRKALNKKLDPVTRARWVCVCVSDRAWVHVRTCVFVRVRAWACVGVRVCAWAYVGVRGRAWACVGVRGRA